MPVHHRKLKTLTFTMDGTEFQCQIRTWRVVNNTEDGEKFYTFCGPDEDGEFREDAEPDYALELGFFDDWQLNGISDFLTQNNNQVVAFQIDHHPDIPGEHVRRSGQVKLKAPSMGGEARTTESNEITLPIIGEPEYTRV